MPVVRLIHGILYSFLVTCSVVSVTEEFLKVHLIFIRLLNCQYAVPILHPQNMYKALTAEMHFKETGDFGVLPGNTE